MFPAKDPLYGKHAKNMMKTDVRETDDAYEVDIDLPGFKKEEINVDLKDGYLTISATKSSYKELTQALLDLGIPAEDIGEINID